jgi:hypothetical protein
MRNELGDDVGNRQTPTPGRSTRAASAKTRPLSRTQIDHAVRDDAIGFAVAERDLLDQTGSRVRLREGDRSCEPAGVLPLRVGPVDGDDEPGRADVQRRDERAYIRPAAEVDGAFAALR